MPQPDDEHRTDTTHEGPRPPVRARPDGSCNVCRYELASMFEHAASGADGPRSTSRTVVCPECGTPNRPPWPGEPPTWPALLWLLTWPSVLALVLGGLAAIGVLALAGDWLGHIGEGVPPTAVLLATCVAAIAVTWAVVLMGSRIRRLVEPLRSRVHRSTGVGLSDQRAATTAWVLGLLTALDVVVVLASVAWALLYAFAN